MRTCAVCGCTDEVACFHHRDRPDLKGSWSLDDDTLCAGCDGLLARHPLLRAVLAARLGAERRTWPGPVPRYAQLGAFARHDVLFCAVHHAGEDRLDPVAYRARLVEVAATCLDLAEAIDLTEKELTS